MINTWLFLIRHVKQLNVQFLLSQIIFFNRYRSLWIFHLKKNNIHKHFIKIKLFQEWEIYDFQTGLLECVYALRKKLIVIFFEDIKYVDIDPRLRLVFFIREYFKLVLCNQLRSAISTATTIQWKDNKFWDKVISLLIYR